MSEEQPNNDETRASDAWPPEETRESATLDSPASRDTSFSPPPDSLTGYQILKELHRGGQGVVYQAIQQSTRRKVAIKVMREGEFAGVADKARFDREIQVLGQLKHPNIVTIHDSGTAAGRHYFVMDYISGQSLDAYMQSAERPIEETLRLFGKICGAVHAAHLLGVVHRDLKPSNIRIDENGEPHVLDFGLAKVATGRTTEEPQPQAMTVTGQFMGSLPWASPEQAEALPSKIDIRSDVYSLGVILYQLLTGRLPYEVVGSPRDVLDRIIHAEPARPSAIRRLIDNELETIVLKCLQKERDRRYQSAGDLARDVGHYLAGEPIEARRDSVSYVLRKRAAATVSRHPLVTCVLIGVLATLFAHLAGVQVVFHWSPANEGFEWIAYGSMPATTGGAPFENVRVLALTGDTDVPQIAAQLGLDPDCLQDDPRGLRQVHGRLMTRLAAARPAALAWDISFVGPSPYDEELVRGIGALRDAGCEVVVAADSWSLSSEGLPPLAPRVAATARWGCTPAQLGAGTQWRLPLVVQRDLADPLPALAVAAFAAFRQPGTGIDLRLDAADGVLTLLYWRRPEGALWAKAPTDDQDQISLSTVRPAPHDVPRAGIRRADTVGYYLLNLPPDDVLQSATADYGYVFTVDQDELKDAFAGKIVLIGDRRRPQAHYPTPDGRRIWGTYAHAVAVDMLLRQASIRLPRPPQWYGLTGLAAVLGVLTGWVLFGRGLARGLGLAAVSVVFIALSLLAAWRWHALYNPLIAVVALVAASELAALARGMCRFRGSTRPATTGDP